jgi:hypothetical protein
MKIDHQIDKWLSRCAGHAVRGRLREDLGESIESPLRSSPWQRGRCGIATVHPTIFFPIAEELGLHETLENLLHHCALPKTAPGFEVNPIPDLSDECPPSVMGRRLLTERPVHVHHLLPAIDQDPKLVITEMARMVQHDLHHLRDLIATARVGMGSGQNLSLSDADFPCRDSRGKPFVETD